METWAVIAQWLVYGSSLTAAVMGIYKFFQWGRSKTTVAKLQADIQRHEELLDNDNIRIKKLETQGDTVEADLKDIHVLLQLSIKSNQALLKGMLDGNNEAAIRKVSDEIQDYLNSQI